jgi:hypothetical protein
MAVVISAVVFGLAHFDWGIVGILQTTFMGLALAISYLVVKRNLWVLVLAHAYIDTVLLVQMYIGPAASAAECTPSPQSIQSVAVHLISLYLGLDRGYSLERATQGIRQATTDKGAFVWLEPPASLGSVTVMDVHRARDPIEHRECVERWAKSVWEAWAPHHATVRRWAEK